MNRSIDPSDMIAAGPETPGSAAPAGFGDVAYRVLGILDTCLRRLQARRRLMAMDDRLLADVGLTRERAEAEAAKPFWRD